MTGIRLASRDHLRILSALYYASRLSGEHGMKPRQFHRHVRERLRSSTDFFYLASAGSKYAGYIHCQSSPPTDQADKRLWVKDWFVIPGFRNLGLGTALLEEIVTHCLFEGYRELTFDVSPDCMAIGILNKLGFRQQDDSLIYIWTNPET